MCCKHCIGERFVINWQRDAFSALQSKLALQKRERSRSGSASSIHVKCFACLYTLRLWTSGLINHIDMEPLFTVEDELWAAAAADVCAPPSVAQNTDDDDLFQFFNSPMMIEDGFDDALLGGTLLGSHDAKDLLCMKEDTLAEGDIPLQLSMDGFEDLLERCGSLGSVAMEDLKSGSTLGTGELVKDERMGYVFGMLVDNIMGSTLSDTPQFGHEGEAGMVNDFEGRVSDEHLRDLCRANKHPEELFNKMKVPADNCANCITRIGMLNEYMLYR